MEYQYTNKPNSPRIDNIVYMVSQSAMANKNIGLCKWSAGDETLRVNFDTELSAGDKTLLDGIVADPSTSQVEGDNVSLVSPAAKVFSLGVDDDGVLVTEEVT